MRNRLVAKLKPDGFNIGVNDGLAAGPVQSPARINVEDTPWRSTVPAKKQIHDHAVRHYWSELDKCGVLPAHFIQLVCFKPALFVAIVSRIE